MKLQVASLRKHQICDATKCAKYREANLRCLGQSLRGLLGQLLVTLTAKRHSSRGVSL